LFYSANLSEAYFEEASLRDAWFTGANLTGAKFVEVDLTGTHLYYANLTGAILSGARFNGTDLDTANLIDARLPDISTMKDVLWSSKTRWGAAQAAVRQRSQQLKNGSFVLNPTADPTAENGGSTADSAATA
jgi:uncharacterized protein YjbI with pentapeptide repeats